MKTRVEASTHISRYFRTWAWLALALATSSPAWAALLAYEGFDYADGVTLAGLNGGSGWSGAWSANGTPNTPPNLGAVSLNGSLNYADASGKTLVTSGGRGFFTGQFGTAQPFRNLTTARGTTTNATTTWISVIAVRQGPTTNVTANPYPRGGSLRFHNVGTERFSVGNASGAATGDWYLTYNGSPNPPSLASTNPVNQQCLVVLRVDHLEGNDNVWMFLNPAFGVEPDISTASSFLSGPGDLPVTRLYAFAGANDLANSRPYAELVMDEIRVGETYADVTPWIPPVTYQWDFNTTNLGTTISPTVGGGGTLTFRNATGTATDLFSPANGGVSAGQVSNDRAFDNSASSSMGASGGVAASAAGNVNLGSLSKLTLTAWIKPAADFNSLPLNAQPRIILVGAASGYNGGAGGANFGIVNTVANSRALQFQASLGDSGVVSSSNVLQGSEWLFVAVTYDADLPANNVVFYVGEAGFSARPVGSATYTNGPVGFGTAASAYLLNRASSDQAFDGWGDDFRIYSAVLGRAELDSVRITSRPKPAPPTVLQSPANRTIVEGHGVPLRVVPGSGSGLTYQWYQGPTATSVTNAIPGATNALYATPVLSLANSGISYKAAVISAISGSVTSSVATVTVVPASELVLTPGMLSFEWYRDVPGSFVSNLWEAASVFPNAPDDTFYLTAFDSRTVFPNDANDNYGARITGWITPTESAEYHFFLRADTTAELFLSTNSAASNAALIAEEPFAANLNPFQEPGVDVSTSLPINLTAGTRYALVLYFKENNAADVVQVAWRKTSDGTPAASLQPIPSAYLSTLARSNGTVAFTSQPTNKTAAVNSIGVATFQATVQATGTPLVLQWQRNGTNIPGATGTSHTIPGFLSPADDGAKFRLVASVPGVAITSQEATLTVSSDTQPPGLVYVVSTDQMTVSLNFTEPMDAPTAAALPNYSINGVGLVSAGVRAGRPQIIDVVTAGLTLNSNYTLSLTGLKDTAGNLLGNRQVTFRAQSYAGDITALPALITNGVKAVGSISAANRGFHLDGFRGTNQATAGSLLQFTEEQFQGLHGPNLAVPSELFWTNTIDFDQDGVFTGHLNTGVRFPYLTDQTSPVNFHSMIVKCFVHLTAGIHRWGVNFNDGCVVTLNPTLSANDPNQITLCGRDPGPGGQQQADSVGDFIVPQDGLYPIRLVYWQISANSQAEWWELDTAADPNIGPWLAINGTDGGPAAYYEATLPLGPLSIAISGANITLSWDANQGATLVSSSNLNSGAVWGVVPGAGTGTYTTPATNAATFYRLSR